MGGFGIALEAHVNRRDHGPAFAIVGLGDEPRFDRRHRRLDLAVRLRRDFAARQRLVRQHGLAEAPVKGKGDRRQADGDQHSRCETRAPRRRGRLRGLGRRGDEAARGLGAGALRLPLRQEPALDVAPDLLELRLIKRAFSSPPAPLSSAATGEAAAKARPGPRKPPFPPGQTKPSTSLSAAVGGRRESRGSVIAKRSLGLVKIGQRREIKALALTSGFRRSLNRTRLSCGRFPNDWATRIRDSGPERAWIYWTAAPSAFHQRLEKMGRQRICLGLRGGEIESRHGKPALAEKTALHERGGVMQPADRHAGIDQSAEGG